MRDVTVTHVGGPTTLIEVGEWRLLTDPTFDPAGGEYRFGWGTGSTKLVGPALAPDDLGAIDAVLLTHDHHEDNLDRAGRQLLPLAGQVVTTKAGSRRLGGGARGLGPWDTIVLDHPGRPSIAVTATPCRHGPPLSRPIVGEVIGFSLAWEGQTDGELWLSGDTVLYDQVLEVSDRLTVDVALIHLGGVQFRVSGPVRYTMTASDAVELCRRLRPKLAIPIHYEGWRHFRQGRDEIERVLAQSPAELAARFRWLPIGVPASIDDLA